MHKKFFLIIFFLITITINLGPFYTYSIAKNKWQLSLFGSKILKYEDQDFGGISGITLSENGENFVLLSDKSFFFKGKIVRNNLIKRELKSQNLINNSLESILEKINPQGNPFPSPFPLSKN